MGTFTALLTALLCTLALLVGWLAMLVVTQGAWGGLAALPGVLGASAFVVNDGSGKGRRALIAHTAAVLPPVGVAIAVCVPTAPTHRVPPPTLAAVSTFRWRLATGSRVAVYRYAPAGLRRQRPVVFLHGGPVRGVSTAEHRFLANLAAVGYNVYSFDQPGPDAAICCPCRSTRSRASWPTLTASSHGSRADQSM